jgi:hypothetical protein
MIAARARRIADAVLYEGYLLYPYRPSAVKNRHRFTFGVLYPESHAATFPEGSADRAWLRTECLVEGGPSTLLEASIRFLHLAERVAEPAGAAQSWQEAVERDVPVTLTPLDGLTLQPVRQTFGFRAAQEIEHRPGHDAPIVRRRRSIDGVIELGADQCQNGLYRVWLRLVYRTQLGDPLPGDRNALLLQSFVSAHVILTVSRGSFVSLLDPPTALSSQAAACTNVGVWPVLAGEPNARDTLLASPIILYDYPEIAPETAGDLFDATEIDEILSLRILTLTDDEKRQMCEADARARLILERTESLGAEEMMQLHGTLRHPAPPRTDA